MIDLCITYIAAGIQYLTHLTENAKDLADNPDSVKLRVSFHDGEDRKALEPIKGQFESITQAKSYRDRSILFWPSANHSSAVNALAKECTGDISIFCDYDMAFLRKGWDTELLELEADIAGVPYQPFSMSIETKWVKETMPYLQHAKIGKYQKLPNLSFLSMKQKVLRDVFKNKLTDFDEYLAARSIPFRIINTYRLGKANNLAAGVVQWMDTGYEIPELIMDHELTYTVMEHCGISVLKQYPRDQINTLTCPEVFELHGEPFLAHYKKGSKKAQKGAEYSFLQFIEDTNAVSKVRDQA